MKTVVIYPGTFIKAGLNEAGRTVGTVTVHVDGATELAIVRFNGDATYANGLPNFSNMIVAGFMLDGKPFDYKWPFEVVEGMTYDPKAFDLVRNAKDWAMVE